MLGWVHGASDDIFEDSTPRADLPQENWLLLHPPSLRWDIAVTVLLCSRMFCLSCQQGAFPAGTCPQHGATKVSSAVNKTVSMRADHIVGFLGPAMSLQCPCSDSGPHPCVTVLEGLWHPAVPCCPLPMGCASPAREAMAPTHGVGGQERASVGL